MAYAIDLYDLTGALVLQDANFESAAARWDLDGPGSLEVSIHGAHISPEPLWLPGRRRVVLRDGSTPIWGGHLLGLSSEGSSGRAYRYSARALGYAGALDGRVVLGDFSRTSTAATTVAWDLIQHAQAQPNGNLGITLGTISGTAPAVTRHYCDGDVIGDAIDELASKEPGGFDWEIAADLKFNAWVGGRGTDKTGTVTLTDADVQEWRVEEEASDLATYAHAFGMADDPCGPPVVTSSSSLASTHVRRDAVVEIESRTTTELQAAADNELTTRSRARRRLRVAVREQDDAKNLRSLALGDRITVVLDAVHGGSQAMRLVRRSVTVESADLAWWELEFETVS